MTPPAPSLEVPGVRVLPLDDALWGDERGWGARPFDAAGPPLSGVGGVHLVSLEPGAVRGNHRHPGTREWLLLFGGPVTLAWRSGAGEGRRRFPGVGPVLVEVEADVHHAVRGDAPHAVHLLSWADGEPETHAVEPLL